MRRAMTRIEVLLAVALLAITAVAISPWLREIRRLAPAMTEEAGFYDALAFTRLTEEILRDPGSFGIDPSSLLMPGRFGVAVIPGGTTDHPCTFQVLHPDNRRSPRLWIKFTQGNSNVLRWIETAEAELSGERP